MTPTADHLLKMSGVQLLSAFVFVRARAVEGGAVHAWSRPLCAGWADMLHHFAIGSSRIISQLAPGAGIRSRCACWRFSVAVSPVPDRPPCSLFKNS